MGEKIKSYRDLKVWQKAIELAKYVYDVTKDFPADERYGLTQQMRRSSVSVAANIAEGQARSSRNEFVNFLYLSRGSLAELDTQNLLSVELGHIGNKDSEVLVDKIDELQRMIYSLIEKLGGRRR